MFYEVVYWDIYVITVMKKLFLTVSDALITRSVVLKDIMMEGMKNTCSTYMTTILIV